MTNSLQALAIAIAITPWLRSDVRGQEPMEYLAADEQTYETVYGAVSPLPPHFVLEPPKPRPHAQPGSRQVPVVTEHGQEASANTASQTGVLPHEKVAEHFLHADKTPRPVAIPEAVRVPVWKTPYSYGHFGASRNRQWTLHHGYQNGYTQWTLR